MQIHCITKIVRIFSYVVTSACCVVQWKITENCGAAAVNDISTIFWSAPFASARANIRADHNFDKHISNVLKSVSRSVVRLSHAERVNNFLIHWRCVSSCEFHAQRNWQPFFLTKKNSKACDNTRVSYGLFWMCTWEVKKKRQHQTDVW